MKRIILIILTLCIFIGIAPSAYAEEVPNSHNIISRINYDDIEKTILERNMTVKINKDTIATHAIEYSNLADTESNIEFGIAKLETLVSIFREHNTVFEKPSDDFLKDNPELENIYSNLDTVFTLLKDTNDSNIITLENNISSMKKQLESMQKQKNDMARGIQKIIIQAEMTNNEVVRLAESLIFAYNSIQQEEKNINISLATLQKNLNAMNIKHSLGYVSKQDVQDLQSKIEDLDLTKEALIKQKENLKGELNLFLGQAYDTPLEIIFTQTLDDNKLNSMDDTKDLNTILSNSYTLELQQYEVDARKNYFDMVEDECSEQSDEYLLASKELEIEKLRFEESKNKNIISFRNLYKEVKNKQKSLTLENKKLQYEKDKLNSLDLKYSLGLISKLEYDNAKESYDTQVVAIETAKADLFKSYRKYEWMLKGLSVQ